MTVADADSHQSLLDSIAADLGKLVGFQTVDETIRDANARGYQVMVCGPCGGPARQSDDGRER